jgi:hypothetical protein
MTQLTHRPTARLLQPAPAGDELLNEVARLLGLPGAQAQQLQCGAVDLDRGYACQLMIDRDALPGGVRPCLRLPLSAFDLDGLDAVRLLALQAQLLAEGLWYLGVSRDGRLQLTALQLFRVAQDIVQVIDSAQGTARLVTQALALSPAPAAAAAAA